MPRFALLIVAAAILGLGLVGYTAAQDASTPTSSSACASPLAMGSPASTTGTTAMASPQASPCASPAAGAQTGGNPAVTMVDINFKPKTFTIPANTDVTVALTNSGAAVHNFNIDELNIHSGDYQPGQTGTITINAKPGTYTYYCNIPGHKDAGMVGQLTVQ